MPLISIVTIGRNPGASIQSTLASVRAQIYPNIEYIVVDGASQDGTLAWLKANEDQIDYWISEPDAGIYAAMNKGLMLARGSIIGLLNCGDEYTRNCCEIVARRIPLSRASDAIILAGAMERTDEGRNIAFKLAASEQRLLNRLRHGMPLNHPATFVTTEAYRAVGLFDPTYRVCGDYEFIYRAAKSGRVQFEFTQDTLAIMPMGGVSERVSSLRTRVREHYRIRKGSIPMIQNIFNCARLATVGGVKLVAKTHLSSAVLKTYYRLRHRSHVC